MHVVPSFSKVLPEARLSRLLAYRRPNRSACIAFRITLGYEAGPLQFLVVLQFCGSCQRRSPCTSSDERPVQINAGPRPPQKGRHEAVPSPGLGNISRCSAVGDHTFLPQHRALSGASRGSYCRKAASCFARDAPPEGQQHKVQVAWYFLCT